MTDEYKCLSVEMIHFVLDYSFVVSRYSFNEEEHFEFNNVSEDKLIGTRGVEATVSFTVSSFRFLKEGKR